MREEFVKAHPIVQILVLILLGFAGMFIAVLLTVLPSMITGGGMDLLKGLSNISDVDSSTLFQLKILQITQSLGLFVVPYIMYRYWAGLPSYGHGFTSSRILPVVLFGLTMACAFPFVNWLALLNSNLHLPGLPGIEDWIYSMEAQAEVLIKKFLYMETVGDLIFNIVVIALVPAISEELCFRGALQPIFSRWLGNKHVAIWATAFFFSFIHLQFLGFLPRFLLGAVLGYAALWSNSLVVPVVGHFINNALAVLMAWWIGEASLESDYAFFSSESENLLYAAGSLVLMCLGMFAVHKFTRKEEQLDFQEV